MKRDRSTIRTFFRNSLKEAGREEEHDARERVYFDRMAEEEIARGGPELWRIDLTEAMPARYHAFWRALGDLSGRKTLDIGCGNGDCAIRLALRGAEVYAFDVSPRMCELTRQRALANAAHVEVQCQSAVRLAYRDESFDLITGLVSLHHLPLETSARELCRVLKRGGVGIFLEPVHAGRSWLWLRSLLPVPCAESPGGGALRWEEIRSLGPLFGSLSTIPFECLGRLRKIPGVSVLGTVFDGLDTILLKIPGIGSLAAYALIVLKRT